MICGTCRHPFSLMVFLRIHWIQTGCLEHRQIWERVFRARRQGTSGRKILHDAYPHLYQVRPMPEEVKQRLRSLDKERTS